MARYLDRDDYTISIGVQHLNEILDQAAEETTKKEDDLLQEAELTAQATIEAYLTAKFDIATEFAKLSTDDPDTRYRLIMKCMVCLSIYHLYLTISPRDIPELRENEYNNCIDMLDSARAGQMALPGLGDATDPVVGTAFGSNTKFISKPFLDNSLQE